MKYSLGYLAVVAVVLALAVLAGSGCGSAQSTTIPNTVVLADDAVIREASIKDLMLTVKTTDSEKDYIVNLRDVRVEIVPRLDLFGKDVLVINDLVYNVHAHILGHYKKLGTWLGWNVPDAMTIYVQTADQKRQWDEKIRQVFNPGFVLPR